MTNNGKWKEDRDFINWLKNMKYAKEENGKLVTCMSLGTYLYMYEAFSAGKKKPKNNGSFSDQQIDPYEIASFQGVF